MNFPNGLFYTKDHEWAQQGADDVVTVGVTDHAQEALGEVVYVELPKIGRVLKAHETFGVVESIKAVSDLYAPVAGTVVSVNDGASNDPSVINRSPYGDGWIMKIKLTDKGALSSLMTAADYQKYVDSLK